MARSAPLASASRMVWRRARGTGAERDHFAAVLFFQLQRLFERVGIGLVDLEAQVVFWIQCPAASTRSCESRTGTCLMATIIFMSNRMLSYNFLKIRQPLVPPNPKEFESA